MKSSPVRILAVSQTNELPRRIRALFTAKKMRVDVESAIGNESAALDANAYDVVVLAGAVAGGRVGKAGSMRSEWVDRIGLKRSNTQVIMLVEPDGFQDAIPALKTSRVQYAKLPVSDEELRLLIETALSIKSKNGAATNEKQPIDGLVQLVGRSAPMQKIYDQIRQAASSRIPVLLLGETGTGKELAANAIHSLGDRKQGPFIPVNLGALPTGLTSSELFGHERGAFTGAVQRHRGVFEQADRGTVFLDEIDSADQKMQVSLLRLIERNSFQRIGGREVIKSRARLITASNQDIEESVNKGVFRQDLFYRLDVFRITLPPLRERKEDIPLLVTEFLRQCNHTFPKKISRISRECTEKLQAYDWRGNVRELKNVIQRAVLVSEDAIILPEHLPPRFQSIKPSRPSVTFEIGTPIHKVEREMIIRTLSMANNNRKQAAELLGISRRAIYNKLNKHKLI